jgi:hypothetical protein
MSNTAIYRQRTRLPPRSWLNQRRWASKRPSLGCLLRTAVSCKACDVLVGPNSCWRFPNCCCKGILHQYGHPFLPAISKLTRSSHCSVPNNEQSPFLEPLSLRFQTSAAEICCWLAEYHRKTHKRTLNFGRFTRWSMPC